ncbi:hypothetical protein JCM8097_000341 [Rhodosporidiobolus ruineniae]
MSSVLDLSPGQSLGPFQLGSMLFNVLNHVRTYRSAYPHAKVAWDEENPSTEPLHITLTNPPLHLLFSPLDQRLSRIEVSGLSPGACVSYRGRPLQADGEDDEDVVKAVRRAFGPTYGSSRAEAQMGGQVEEMLSYPGVAFGVIVGAHGSILSRIILTPLPPPAGVPVDQAWLHPVLPLSPAAAAGDLRVAQIFLDTSNHASHVLLHFYSSSTDGAESPVGAPPFELRIGETTSEDVLCELGGAIRTFWKEDDRMTIHTNGVGDSSLSPNPYFLSYPHLGLTLLLSSAPSATQPAHTLLKTIFHSNTPGEVNFGRTARARWVLVREDGKREAGAEDGAEKVMSALRRRAPSEGEKTSGGWSGALSLSPSPLLAGLNGGGGKKSKPGAASPLSSSPGSLGARGRLAEQPVENLLGLSTFEDPSAAPAAKAREGKTATEEHEKPMILDRTADGSVRGGKSRNGTGENGGGGVRGKTTEIHGFPGIALEVTQEGEVETVWLF